MTDLYDHVGKQIRALRDAYDGGRGLYWDDWTLAGQTRLAMIAAERPVPLAGAQAAVAGALRDAGADAFRLPTAVAPVSLERCAPRRSPLASRRLSRAR